MNQKEIDIITQESDALRGIAHEINGILRYLFSHVQEDGFDTNLDFSSFETTTLKDFWLYTSCFIGLGNDDDIDSKFSDYELDQMLNGYFTLKNLSTVQANKLIKDAKKSKPSKSKPAATSIYTVQEGTYYVNTATSRTPNSTPGNFLSLVTYPLEYKSESNTQPTARQIFKLLRNIFAHRSPYVDENDLYFYNNDTEIRVSKLWLRGFTEIFSKKFEEFEIDTLLEKFKTHCKVEKNNIENLEDVEKVMIASKSLFPEDIQEKYTTAISFILKRIPLNKNFFEQDLEKKLSTLAHICTANPTSLKLNYELVNPSVIYNIEYLLTQEIEKRNSETATIDPEDPTYLALQDVKAQLDAHERTLKILTNKAMQTGSMPNLSSFDRKTEQLKNLTFKLIAELKAKTNAASSNLELIGATDVSSLPVEVAVNLVLLLAYNNLVTSNFYEDTLRRTDNSNLSEKQLAFFSRFDLSKIIKNIPKESAKACSDYRQNAKHLAFIRNSLCHGSYFYTIPQEKEGKKPSVKDTVIIFQLAGHKSVLAGSVESFYNLFMNKNFTCKRPKEVITRFDIPNPTNKSNGDEDPEDSE